MVGVTTAIILDNRRVLNVGTYPIKLRVTFQKKQKYYPTEFSLTEQDYQKVQTDKPRGIFKEIKLKLQAYETKANEVLNSLHIFSFEAFEKKLLTNNHKDDVISAFSYAINKLEKDHQVSTAEHYKSARSSILAFITKVHLNRNKGLSKEEAGTKRKALGEIKKPLPFTAITQDFLKEYESWMLEGGRSNTTISMYLRVVRAIFNEAIAEGNVHIDLYPFGKKKYQIPASKNTKKALVKSDLKKIFDYVPKNDSEARAKDLWVFSYLCNGINVKDIARLRYRQIKKNEITFIRAKTERTNKHNSKTIAIVPNAEIQEIINKIIKKWGNKPVIQDSFVFPILKENLTPEKELALIKQATKTINKYIKRIAKEVGIEENISTYTARHSFATTLKRAGAPTSFISESLGHSNEKTTQNYLDSFDDETKREYSSKLLDFN